jgi:hypothetical protein
MSEEDYVSWETAVKREEKLKNILKDIIYKNKLLK